jgi:uncharacterized protein (DUF1697 family)
VTTYIALLRGINVGGNNKVPMADLRTLMSGMGFGNVRTYIQSGNVVFTAAEENPESVQMKLETGVSDRFGFAVKVMVLTAADILKAVAGNPYTAITDDPAKLHLGFMANEPDTAALEALKSKPQGTDQWTSMDQFFYLYAPDGMGKSVLAPFVERTLKAPVTFRNWRTVLTLKEMAEGRSTDLN